MSEYRIDFTIMHRGPDDDDFAEIGFGGSVACDTVDRAAYDVESIIQNRMWETSPGMPDPAAVDD